MPGESGVLGWPEETFNAAGRSTSLARNNDDDNAVRRISPCARQGLDAGAGVRSTLVVRHSATWGCHSSVSSVCPPAPQTSEATRAAQRGMGSVCCC